MSVYLSWINATLKPLETANLKLVPLGTDWTYATTDDNYDDIAVRQVADPVAVTGVAVFTNPDDGFVGLLFDDVQFGTTSSDIAGVVLYLDSGDPATSPLIAFDRFESGAVENPGTFSYSPFDEGFLQVYPDSTGA